MAKTRVSRVITVEPNSNNEIENNKKKESFFWKSVKEAVTEIFGKTYNELNLILKSLNSKKVSGTDKIPTKLVKLASNFLSKPLATAINQSLVSSKFPDIAKVAAAIPIDKKTDGKSDISNLTCKFIKLFLKNLWKHYKMYISWFNV